MHTDLQILQENYNQLTEKLRQAESNLKSMTDAGITFATKDFTKQRQLRLAVNFIDTIKNNIDDCVYDVKGIRKVLTKFGLKPSKKSTTAVRGHSSYSRGYKVHAGAVIIYGGNTCFCETIKDLLISNGYRVSSSDYFSSVGQGTISQFFIEKVLEKQDKSL